MVETGMPELRSYRRADRVRSPVDGAENQLMVEVIPQEVKRDFPVVGGCNLVGI